MRYEDGPGQPISRPRPLVSPKNMLPVEVIGRTMLAPGVITLYLAIPSTEQPPAPYLPGQFVTLGFPTGTEMLYRSYSLCGDGVPDRPWEITIKRLRDGAVSTYLFDAVQVGTLLYASFPRGAFTLPGDVGAETPLVFVAVGSGITPIIGMLRALALLPPRERPQVQLHYASRTRADTIYGEELDEMDPGERWLRQYHYLSSEGQRLTGDGVIRSVGKLGRRATWYICGPEALKFEMHRLLQARGVPADHILSEVFAAQRGATRIDFQVVNDAQGTDVAQMRVADTGDVLGVRAQETVLGALERHGYHPDYSCRVGTCGTCVQRLLGGNVTAPDAIALTRRERAEGYILTCVAVPQGDIVLASGGRAPVGGADAAGRGPTPLTRLLVRAGTVALASGILLGAWQLTNHRPLSWGAGTAAAPPPSGGAPTAPASSAGGSPVSHPGTKTPTALPGHPAPTVAPGQPAPTTAPSKTTPPAPTATSAPSKPR